MSHAMNAEACKVLERLGYKWRSIDGRHWDWYGPAVKESLTTGAQARIPFSLPDAAIERIYDNARRMFRHHIGSVRGQQVTQADSHEYHIINATLDELRATVDNYQPSAPADDVVRDAERYRWLRSPNTGDHQIWDVCFGHATLRAGTELDDAIDAAMSATASQEKGS